MTADTLLYLVTVALAIVALFSIANRVRKQLMSFRRHSPRSYATPAQTWGYLAHPSGCYCLACIHREIQP